MQQQNWNAEIFSDRFSIKRLISPGRGMRRTTVLNWEIYWEIFVGCVYVFILKNLVCDDIEELLFVVYWEL